MGDSDNLYDFPDIKKEVVEDDASISENKEPEKFQVLEATMAIATRVQNIVFPIVYCSLWVVFFLLRLLINTVIRFIRFAVVFVSWAVEKLLNLYDFISCCLAKTTFGE